MGKFCVMKTCKHANNITSNIKRHKFPSSVELKSKWERFVVEGNRDNHLTLQASDDTILCERHFDASCYNSNGKLKTDAVPTIVDKFTSGTAFKFNLIPSPESELLVNVNKFSKSIIKRARTPEPSEDIEPTSTCTPMEVEDDLVPENIFSSGMLELMVIDLGEEADDTASIEKASVDNDVSSPRVKTEETDSQKSEDSDTDFAPPSFSESTDHDTSKCSTGSASPVISRLRIRTSTGTKTKVVKVESTSTPPRSSKPSPVKKSTPVNTDSRLSSSQSSSVSTPRLSVRTRFSIQPVGDKENSSSTPINSSKPQPAKPTSQPTKTKSRPTKIKTPPTKSITTENTATKELPAGRLRTRNSNQAKLDKNDRPSTPISSSENQKNGKSKAESSSPLRTRLRSRTSLQPTTDKVDSPPKRLEQRHKDSPSHTPEPPAKRLRSRSSIKPKVEEVEKVETSTFLTKPKKAPLAKTKPREKRFSSDDQAPSTKNKTPLAENFPLPSESHVPLANGEALQPEKEASMSGNNLHPPKVNLNLPKGLVLATGNTIPLPGRIAPNFFTCSCTVEEHKKIAGIARIPKIAGIEFTQRTEELTSLKRDLRNIRQKYESAMTKIKTLTIVLDHLKEKRRQKSHRAPAIDCCVHCKKVLN